MKITIVGNMCTWTQELSTSFIINDDLLLDVPQGSFKTLYKNYNLNKINYILITHFHSDHFADLHLVVEILRRREQNFVILAPKSCKERLYNIFESFEVAYLKKFLDDKFIFLDCQNGKTYKIGQYKIKAYKMTHGELDAYGFIIEDKDKVKIGFSGDTCMCNNLHKIIKHSKAIFIDTSCIEIGLKHLTIDEVSSLQKEYSNTIFYPIHLSSNTKNLIKKSGLNETTQGQIIEIN